MLSLSPATRIFVAMQAMDMRHHSECPIIPSEKRKPVKSLDSPGF